MLDVRVRLRLGSFTLEASLEAPANAVTVVVGESGAGKSTLLRLIAGLREPDSGRVTLGDAVLSDRAAGVFAPPESRPIGYVAQDYALFPHLSALDNVAFGPRALGRSTRDARRAADAALERLGVGALAWRRPAELSGGQQQRVALARALVLDPAVLLLDEPLAALDVATRREVRGELRRTLEGLACVTLLVTHQPSEALAFADRVVALEAGRVSQAGSREEFVRRPRSRYVAEFLGINLIEGIVRARRDDGLAFIDAGGGELAVPDPGRAGPVRLLLHPHTLVLSVDAPSGSAVNVLRGAVEEVIPEPPGGERVRVLLGTTPRLTAEVTRHSAATLGLAPGRVVYASFKASAIEVLDD